MFYFFTKLVIYDVTGLNNCHATVLANVETKLLETVILHKVQTNNKFDDYQFGFKKGISTGLCTSEIKQTLSTRIH